MKIQLLFLFLFISFKAFSQTPEQRLERLEIHLPDVPEALGLYVDIVKVGSLLYLSGKGPRKDDGEYVKGKLGEDLTLEQGVEAARISALNQLAVLKRELGSLDRVKRVVKVNGFVNSSALFYDQSKVINGFSDVMIEIFGASGRHARTAIGTNVLPLNMAVEVEMIVEIEQTK